MRALLDTHILLWYLEGNSRLPLDIRQQLDQSHVFKFVSAVSFWELSIKQSLGKIKLKESPSQTMGLINRSNLRLLNMQASHLSMLEQLPFHHRDPFDRLLIATALSEGLTLISADSLFKNYAQLELLHITPS
ncbi:MAG: type II toxin-antitoxin system VapC family toxin [Candidatus Sericytochromatia bacterium]